MPPLPFASLHLSPRWMVAGLAAVTLLALVPWRPTAQAPARPVHWEGTLTSVISEDFARQENPWADGVWTATFQVRVRWLEARRIDVKDPSGRTTGQFVELVDDGSSWTAEAGGVAVTRRRPERLQLSGSGSGGSVLHTCCFDGWAWVYHSLADDDPLKDILPNGTYSFWAFADLQVLHTFTSGGTVILQRSPAEVPSETMVDWIGRRGGQMFGQVSEFKTTSLRQAFDRVNDDNADSYPYADHQYRAVIDGRMQGSFEGKGRPGPEGGTTHKVTWDLHRRLGITGTLDAIDAKWRPKLLDRITVRASIDPSLGVTGRFRFTLFDVSREKGSALNAGGSGTGLDLRFSSEQPQPMGQVQEPKDSNTLIIETNDAGTSAGVTIVAFDYGAWGRLKAEVIVDGEWYLLDAASGGSSITVPLDENGNRIWDGWERNAGVWDQAATADQDDEPAGENRGDGFSNFEEYRGFMVGADWVTTSPKHKDLFIYDAYARGVGYFGASGVLTYTIQQTQYDTAPGCEMRKSCRVVNFNRGYASAGAQKGLLLTGGCGLDETTAGEVFPDVGTPNDVEKVCINESMMRTYSADEEATTIAHELGHAVSVEHHGDYDEGKCNGGDDGVIATWGGATSGHRGCVMAYSDASYYRGWDGRCYAWTFPAEFGDQFCTSKAGTGINSGARRMEDGHPMPVSGSSSAGNCQHQVRLK